MLAVPPPTCNNKCREVPNSLIRISYGRAASISPYLLGYRHCRTCDRFFKRTNGRECPCCGSHLRNSNIQNNCYIKQARKHPEILARLEQHVEYNLELRRQRQRLDEELHKTVETIVQIKNELERVIDAKESEEQHKQQPIHHHIPEKEEETYEEKKIVMNVSSCANNCAAYPKHVKGKPYELGYRYCSNCQKYLITEEIRCPCCQTMLRRSPRFKNKRKDQLLQRQLLWERREQKEPTATKLRLYTTTTTTPSPINVAFAERFIKE